ncbi:ABC transporter ATP-binding protein [Desulfurivibrio alkaliphilus]|uniref:ABC transporter related protein n=1 Tax=Desulfurivibrio alkaliphilus (strain DSM 19089 / UNIQEM U267 / AHT2) TaxID=589865 RepID=D6Z6W2_DESAT|nr:ABC transporter ATP-binding protein [Desulfurivibrio alkaliphilus]ADH86949.1 ABC transporter related protein [Desulfurivibrio alkaliphilus AHT 2]
MIKFNQIEKTYAKELGRRAKQALAGVSFALAPGETLGLVGANGAGKSTCIKLLLDFIRADRGEISLLGSTPKDPAVRRRIGYLPETANFPANLNVLDMLRFSGRTCGLSREQIAAGAEKWLSRLSLWPDRKRPLRDYSKGMQQRANFALALLHEPELLILDEPMSGLDPIGRADMLGLIGELKAKGRSILFCSHILEDVDRLADRVLVLHRGRKLFEGMPAELAAQRGGRDFTAGYLDLVQSEGEQ